MASFKAAVLVISTTAAKDHSQDTSGAILSDVFSHEGDGRWEVVETKIVGDVVQDIQKAIKDWTDRDGTTNVVVTTGGTGFAVHDITPEVW
jgi:gephyrin